MTTEEAYNLLEILKSQNTREYDIKFYEKFLHILTGLKLRNFSKHEQNILRKPLANLRNI
jgi:hypothetical protein